MKCPKCSEPLFIALHPTKDILFIVCPQASTHLAMHIKPKEAREWLNAYKTDIWLD
jgi:hypothetical protein